MAARLLRDKAHLATLRLPVRLEAALTKHTVANLRKQSRRGRGDAAPTVDEFVAHRLDRSYAAAHRAMREARARLPTYTPRRMLDFGAGLSPMAWAAQAAWPGASLQVCAVEPNPKLREAGAQLCAAASVVPHHTHAPHWSEPIPGADQSEHRPPRRAREPQAVELKDPQRQQEDEYDEYDEYEEEGEAMEVPVPGVAWRERLPTPEEAAPFELVSAHHCLVDLPAESVEGTMRALWGRTAPGGLLALVEPATPVGFAQIALARRALCGDDEHAAAAGEGGGGGGGAATAWGVRLSLGRARLCLDEAEIVELAPHAPAQAAGSSGAHGAHATPGVRHWWHRWTPGVRRWWHRWTSRLRPRPAARAAARGRASEGEGTRSTGDNVAAAGPAAAGGSSRVAMRLEVEVGKTAGGRRRVACRAAAARLRVQLAPPQVIALRRLSVLSAHWSGWEAAVRARYPSAAPYPVPHLTPT